MNLHLFFSVNDPACFSIQSSRYCEFGHAVLDRLLDGAARRPPPYYIGFLREEQRDCAAALEDKIYKHWDASDGAPARRRPTEAVVEPTLEMLSWANGAPSFPEPLLTKFAEGSQAFVEVHAMKKELLQQFPDSCRQSNQGQGQTQRTGNVRATGRADFTIDGGAQPVDVTRLIEKQHIPQSAFDVTRLWAWLGP